MPYRWIDHDNPDAPTVLILWPHRSLTARGFVWFYGGTAAFIALPILAVLGTAILWALLPFILITMAGLWFAVRASNRAGELFETLTLDETDAHLVRHDPKSGVLRWRANRHWVTVQLHPTAGPVANYLTLRGGNRDVELGAFLDPDERKILWSELRHAF